MSSSAQKITQTFNGRVEWNIGGGGFFKLLSTVNPVDVELYHSGRQVLLAPQVDGGFYQRVAFDRVVLTTGALEAVSFLVAPDEGGSDTFSGVVDVSDDAARLLGTLSPWAGKNRLYSPGFMRGGTQAAVAAQAFYARLDNPGGSGVRLFVDRVHLSSNAAATFEIRTGITPAAGALTGYNKTIGGAASVGTLAVGTAAAILGNVIDAGRGAPFVFDRSFEEPIIIPAGGHIALVNATVNLPTDFSIEWREGA